MDDSSSIEINNLLTEWKLQHLSDKFKEENITINTLKIIQPHHVKKLFLSLRIGDQAHFEFHLKNWKKRIGCDEVETQPELKVLDDSPKAAIRRAFPSVCNILSSTKTGNDIIQFYEKNYVLQEEHRAVLLNTITKYLEVNGYDCSLSECADIEKQICKIFPTEELSFYTNGKRGKLYNKLANSKRLAKEVFKEQNITSEETVEYEPSENYALWVQYLRSEISNADFAASQLINIDFTLKYPNAKCLKDIWPQLGDAILNIIKNKCGGSLFF